MEKIKELFKNNKNIAICAVSVLILILIVILVLVLKPGENREQKENKLEARLGELADVYYKIYYELLSDEQKKALSSSNYSTIGIKADLINLAVTVSEQDGLPTSDEIIKEFTVKGKECDQRETMIIIYPQEPYGAKDYKTEVVLKCE